MDLPISLYKYEKVLIENCVFKIPEKILYLFQFGYRRSVKVIPIYTTWNKEIYEKEEAICELSFIIVGDSFDRCIQRFNINISQIESIMQGEKGGLSRKMLEFISNYDEHNIRTKEQFEKDFNHTLERINE